MDGFNGAPAGVTETEEGGKVEVEGKKERSVLQAKLTRLAIQIGYAGIFIIVHLIKVKLLLRLIRCRMYCTYLGYKILHLKICHRREIL